MPSEGEPTLFECQFSQQPQSIISDGTVERRIDDSQQRRFIECLLSGGQPFFRLSVDAVAIRGQTDVGKLRDQQVAVVSRVGIPTRLDQDQRVAAGIDQLLQNRSRCFPLPLNNVLASGFEPLDDLRFDVDRNRFTKRRGRTLSGGDG